MKFLLQNPRFTIPNLYLWNLIFVICILSLSCKKEVHSSPYQDLQHNSRIFSKQKFYRLYLPDTYTKSQARFPVIYFFHGWGGRHFKDDNAKLEYEKINDLVNKYQILLVMWDGNITEDQPRPYNIGNHENINSQIQMADYFLELKDHIDSTNRTLKDRSHTGIIGFSMGGFLSYFIAGKYPDLVSAAVNMTGSPEFFVGQPENHTLVPLRYMFKNLREINLRFHNSTADELTDLNKEVHQGALWEGNLSYDYWVFEGGHKVDDSGKTEVFEKAMNFITTSFNHPIPKPKTWYHFDIYPEFSVWDYKVISNKKEPGFIYLNEVSKQGFGLSTLKWLPNGPPLENVDIEISTAPLYQPSTAYHILRYFNSTRKINEEIYTSDADGKIHFPKTNSNYVAGIYLDQDSPDLIPIDYTINQDQRFLRAGLENKLSFQFLNRGPDVDSPKKIKIKISASDSTLIFNRSDFEINLKPGQRIYSSPGLVIRCNKKPPTDGRPTEIKLIIQTKIDDLAQKSEILIPLMFDLPLKEDVEIDDGRKLHDSLSIYGQGNGNGIAEAGERLVIYVDGHRTRLYSDDPFIQTEKEKLIDEALPAKWPDGFTLTSIIQIDPACPNNHFSNLMFNYETKDFMPITRKLTWGTIRIKLN